MIYNLGDMFVGADLNSFDGSPEELTAKIQPQFDQQIIGWEEADFGDCWLKFVEKPEMDADGLAEFDGIRCRVNSPADFFPPRRARLPQPIRNWVAWD